MEFAEFIRLYWPHIGGAVGAVFWFARLESAVKTVVRDLEDLKERRKEDRQETEKSRAEVLDTLKEMQRDIRNMMVAMGVPRK